MLLLNQSYEPITVCDVKKAFTLVFLGKAELIEEHPELKIRSVRNSFSLPSVIRLNYYRKVPFKDVLLTRKNILRRDKHKCAYCGKVNIELTVDHIIPKSKGGKDSWENMITACKNCNNKKGSSTPKEVGFNQHYKAYKPNRILFLKNAGDSVQKSWGPYLYNI